MVAHEESVLRLRARGGVKPGVVWRGLYLVGLQYGGKLLHLLAREAVDDAALALVLLDELDDVFVHVLRLRPHLVVEVRAVEGAFKLLRANDAEALLYVGAHLVGGSGRERNDGSLANLVDYGAYAAVLRPEVVAPLGYAVSLVDGVERNLDRLQELHVVFFGERLRRYVQQLGAPGAYVGLHLVDGSLVLRRVEVVGKARSWSPLNLSKPKYFFSAFVRFTFSVISCIWLRCGNFFRGKGSQGVPQPRPASRTCQPASFCRRDLSSCRRA